MGILFHFHSRFFSQHQHCFHAGKRLHQHWHSNDQPLVQKVDQQKDRVKNCVQEKAIHNFLHCCRHFPCLKLTIDLSSGYGSDRNIEQVRVLHDHMLLPSSSQQESGNAFDGDDNNNKNHTQHHARCSLSPSSLVAG